MNTRTLQRIDESRRIVMEGINRDYRLKRSKLRRTLALSVGSQGLVVYAPWSLPLNSVEKFVLDQATWVTEKLAQQALLALAQLVWQDGISLRFLGQTIIVKLSADASLIEAKGGVLYVPPHAEKNLQRNIVGWYQRMALAYFHERLLTFVSLLSRHPAQLKLSGARSRWGSCTRNGVVRLNWRLMQASTAEVDYVLAHELAHLTHMNHSPAFWQELARLYPDYEVPRNRLRIQGHHYHQISL
ncbi:MAG: M48 family metallopeptidase [Sulfuriferula sp.]